MTQSQNKPLSARFLLLLWLQVTLILSRFAAATNAIDYKESCEHPLDYIGPNGHYIAGNRREATQSLFSGATPAGEASVTIYSDADPDKILTIGKDYSLSSAPVRVNNSIVFTGEHDYKPFHTVFKDDKPQCSVVVKRDDSDALQLPCNAVNVANKPYFMHLHGNDESQSEVCDSMSSCTDFLELYTIDDNCALSDAKKTYSINRSKSLLPSHCVAEADQYMIVVVLSYSDTPPFDKEEVAHNPELKFLAFDADNMTSLWTQSLTSTEILYGFKMSPSYLYTYNSKIVIRLERNLESYNIKKIAQADNSIRLLQPTQEGVIIVTKNEFNKKTYFEQYTPDLEQRDWGNLVRGGWKNKKLRVDEMKETENGDLVMTGTGRSRYFKVVTPAGEKLTLPGQISSDFPNLLNQDKTFSISVDPFTASSINSQLSISNENIIYSEWDRNCERLWKLQNTALIVTLVTVGIVVSGICLITSLGCRKLLLSMKSWHLLQQAISNQDVDKLEKARLYKRNGINSTTTTSSENGPRTLLEINRRNHSTRGVKFLLEHGAVPIKREFTRLCSLRQPYYSIMLHHYIEAILSGRTTVARINAIPPKDIDAAGNAGKMLFNYFQRHSFGHKHTRSKSVSQSKWGGIRRGFVVKEKKSNEIDPQKNPSVLAGHAYYKLLLLCAAKLRADDTSADKQETSEVPTLNNLATLLSDLCSAQDDHSKNQLWQLLQLADSENFTPNIFNSPKDDNTDDDSKQIDWVDYYGYGAATAALAVEQTKITAAEEIGVMIPSLLKLTFFSTPNNNDIETDFLNLAPGRRNAVQGIFR